MVHGHRGSKGTHFENSLESFREAVRVGADFIEFDVHETSDGEFVVFHDATLKRIGYQGKIAELTVRQVREARLPNGEQIPLLTELVDELAGKIGFNMELKGVKNMRRVLDIVANVEPLLISSFVTEYLYKVKQLSDYQTGFIYFLPFPFRIKTGLRIQADALHPFIGTLTKWGVRRMHKFGFQVNAWTTQNSFQDRRALALNVDGIISDFPSDTIARIHG